MATRFYIYAFFFRQWNEWGDRDGEGGQGTVCMEFYEKLQFRCCTDCYCYTLLLVQDTLKIICMTKSLYI